MASPAKLRSEASHGRQRLFFVQLLCLGAAAIAGLADRFRAIWFPDTSLNACLQCMSPAPSLPVMSFARLLPGHDEVNRANVISP